MTGMRPFFSYYGAKYTVAKYAGAPRRDLVIEPFAGSAAYATRYAPRRAALYDINPDIRDVVAVQAALQRGDDTRQTLRRHLARSDRAVRQPNAEAFDTNSPRSAPAKGINDAPRT